MSELRHLQELIQNNYDRSKQRLSELDELGLDIQGYEILAATGLTSEFTNNPAFEGVPLGIDTNLYNIPTKPDYPFGISIEPYPISLIGGFHGLFFPDCYECPEESFRIVLERITNYTNNPIALILNQSGRINGQHIKCHCQGGGFKHIHIIELADNMTDNHNLLNYVHNFMNDDFQRLNSPETFSSLVQQNIGNIRELFEHVPQYCFATILDGGLQGIKFLPTESIRRTSGLTRQAIASYFGFEGDHRVIMNRAAMDPRKHQRNLIQNWQILHKVLQSS